MEPVLFSIPHSDPLAPGIPYHWSILAVYVNTYINHLPSRERASEGLRRSLARSRETRFPRPNRRARSQANTAHFYILTRKTVFLGVSEEVSRLRYLKRCLQGLPFFLHAVFGLLAFSLLAGFFRSSALIESLTRRTK